MNLPNYIYIVLFAIVYSPAVGQIKIEQRKFQVPLLKGKDINPVLQLKVTAEHAEEVLKAVTFAHVGRPALQAIAELQLWSLGSDSSFFSPAKFHNAVRIGTLKPGKEPVFSLKGYAALQKGSNFFWLTLTLKADASYTQRINLLAVAVTINQGVNPIPKPQKNINQRIGSALRQHQENGVHTHRIPGMGTAKDGSLLAIYDVRYDSARDLQGHMDIGLSRSLDKGKTWLPMQIIMDMGTWGGMPEMFNGVSDACILVDRNSGTIFVAGLWMHGVKNEKGEWLEGLTENSKEWNHQWRNKGSQPGFGVKETAQFLLVKSTDNGKTWSKPINLTKMCKKEEWWLWAPAPGQGITLKDGTLVFPTQGRDAHGESFSNITYSKDGGDTWRTSNAAIDESTTENMAVELSDGTIMLNMRANANRNDTSSRNGRAISVTNDLGETWAEHPTSHGALIEPTCMASIIRHDFIQRGKKKSVLLFCNPASKTQRNNMTVKLSYDDGKTWSKNKSILLDDQKSRGYSCLTSIDNETVGVLYESSQADLVFEIINLKELL